MAVIEATSENFDELIQTAEYAVVDFYGDHCGACVATAPYYREGMDTERIHEELAKMLYHD